MRRTNPRAVANLFVSPEQRKLNHEKASITRRLKLEKEYCALWEKVKELGLEQKSARELAKLLDTYPGKILAMRRYVKGLETA